MKLKLAKRENNKKKSALTKDRFEGNIPASIYNSGKPSTPVTVNGTEFAAHMRSIAKGYLPTTVFELDLEGTLHSAIIKEIQYHSTTYQVRHLDFQLLEDKTPIFVKIPVVFSGSGDCVGVKLGGFIRQILHHVKVRCLPADMPKEFTLDIRNLEIGQSKRIRDIETGDKVRTVINEKEIVVVIAKR